VTPDAPGAAALYASVRLPGAPATPAAFDLALQTGNAFLVAESGRRIFGAIRFREDEGIGWFDLLVSARPWAGLELVRAVERRFQDRGIRLVRCRCPDDRVYEDYFAMLGYLPIGRGSDASGGLELLLERRLPLLTVREQRRSDAAAIGDLTGEDPWVFEQGARPGWFVAADGERIVGVLSCVESRRGVALISVPVLRPEYASRGLDLWMITRAAEYAETNGYHTAVLDAAPALEVIKKGLEDRYWIRDGAYWRRVFFTPRSTEDDEGA